MKSLPLSRPAKLVQPRETQKSRVASVLLNLQLDFCLTRKRVASVAANSAALCWTTQGCPGDWAHASDASEQIWRAHVKSGACPLAHALRGLRDRSCVPDPLRRLARRADCAEKSAKTKHHGAACAASSRSVTCFQAAMDYYLSLINAGAWKCGRSQTPRLFSADAPCRLWLDIIGYGYYSDLTFTQPPVATPRLKIFLFNTLGLEKHAFAL